MILDHISISKGYNLGKIDNILIPVSLLFSLGKLLKRVFLYLLSSTSHLIFFYQTFIWNTFSSSLKSSLLVNSIGSCQSLSHSCISHNWSLCCTWKTFFTWFLDQRSCFLFNIVVISFKWTWCCFDHLFQISAFLIYTF